MSNTATPKLKNFRSIQVLRGIASLLVVFYHASESSRIYLSKSFLGGFFNFGGSGVDMFFVLSGFIITYTSFKDIHEPAKLLSFLRRRFVRIFPVYWLIISGFLLLQVLMPSFYKTIYQLEPGNIIATYLLFPEHIMVNGVSWSLTNELFFYALFALAFLFPYKKLLVPAIMLYMLLLTGLYITGQQHTLGNKWADLFIFPMNVEFFMGVLAALFFSRIPARYGWPLVIAGALLFLTAGIQTDYGNVLLQNGLNRVVYFGIPSFLVIAGVARLELTKDFNPHGILTSLGDASYSLYLVHLPIVAAATKLLARFSNNTILFHLLMLMVIAIICTTSIFFFRYIEQPLIRKLNAKRTKLKPV